MNLLLAIALADAHGLPVENLSPQRIQRWFPKGLPPFLLLGGRGLMSDDTEHAAITARALALSGAHPERFERELARGLKRWLWALPPTTGMATARALVKLTLGVPPKRSGVDSAGNGACMRAPILGALVDDQDLLWELTLRSSRMTHKDLRAIDGAFLVARWTQMARLAGHRISIDQLKNGTNPRHVRPDSSLWLALREVEQSLSKNETAAEFCCRKGWKQGPTGFVMHTVPAAFHVVLWESETWEEAVREAVLLGGDTDSVAALVGAMRCVLPGQDLPKAWVERWRDWPRTKDWLEATERSAMLATSSRTPVACPDVSWGVCLARNLLMWGLVLGHGVRRALPPY